MNHGDENGSDDEIGDDFEMQQGGDTQIDEDPYSSDEDTMKDLDMQILLICR